MKLVLTLVSILALNCALAEPPIPGNEGGHGGDVIIGRILIARSLGLQIVQKSGPPTLTTEQRQTMLDVLQHEPRFSRSDEKVEVKDDDGVPTEVSAAWDPKTNEVKFNVALCAKQAMTQLDALVLYLHEAGHAAGLSTSMARRNADFTKDIGYRLVMQSIERADSPIHDPVFGALFRSGDRPSQETKPPAKPTLKLIRPKVPSHWDPNGRNYVGFVYSAATGASGVSTEPYSDLALAFIDATIACKDNGGTDCQRVFWTGGCGAFAVASNGGNGWGAYDNADLSRDWAMYNCSQRGSGCALHDIFCVSQ